MFRYTDRAPPGCHRNSSLRRDVAGAGCPRTPAGTGNRTRSRRPKQKGRPKWTAVLRQTAPSGNYLSRNSPNCDQRNRPLTLSVSVSVKADIW